MIIFSNCLSLSFSLSLLLSLSTSLCLPLCQIIDDLNEINRTTAHFWDRRRKNKTKKSTFIHFASQDTVDFATSRLRFACHCCQYSSANKWLLELLSSLLHKSISSSHYNSWASHEKKPWKLIHLLAFCFSWWVCFIRAWQVLPWDQWNSNNNACHWIHTRRRIQLTNIIISLRARHSSVIHFSLFTLSLCFSLCFFLFHCFVHRDEGQLIERFTPRQS